MAIAINREMTGDINYPSAELLNYCINEHAKELDRLQMLFDSYNGEHEILNRKKKDENAPNNKLVINHAKYVTDMNVGFTTGNPIAYSSAEGNDIQPILDEYDRIDIVSHDTELEKDLSVFGIGLELIYLRIDKADKVQINVKKIDPRGIFVVTDDTIDKEPLFSVHYQPVYDLKGDEAYWLIKFYNDNRIITYKALSKGSGEYELIDDKPHFFNDVPVIEYRNNEEKQGDFEQALSLMNAYNLLMSDSINDKEAFVDAILFLMGFELEDGAGEMLKQEGILAAIGDNGSNVDAKYLTKTFDKDSISATREALLDDIHKITYVPNMNDEKFAGNISGEAMKYKLFGLLNLLSVKSRYLTKGLKKRLEIFETYLRIGEPNVDITGTKIKIKPMLPVNTSDVVNIVIAAYEAGILSLSTLLTWLPDIDDPSGEIEKILAETKQKIALQQEAMGGSSSHDDLDLDNEEDEDDGTGRNKKSDNFNSKK